MKALGGVAQFESAVAGGRAVVVEFGAPWCPPCRQVEPVLARVSEQMGVEAFKVDTDKQPDLARRFGVRALPTLIAFVGGVPVGQWVGAASEARLKAWLRGLEAEARVS